MKKTISFLTLSAMAAFFSVHAQEVTQDSTSSDQTYQQPSQDVEAQSKKEIAQAELPDQVKESIKNSEYKDMDVVVVYEINDTTSNITSSTGQDKATSEKPGTAAYQQDIRNSEDVDKQNPQMNDHENPDTNKPQPREETQATEEPSGSVNENESPNEQTTGLAGSQATQMRMPEETDSTRIEAESGQTKENQSASATEDNTSAKVEAGREKDSNMNKDSEKMYEVQVEDQDNVIILVFSEDGTLRQATKGGM